MKHPGRHAQTTARPHLSVVGRSKRAPLVIAACCAVLLAGCHHSETLVSAPKPVVALTLHPDGNAVANTLPGQVQARYSTPLSFRVAGKVVERRVRIGDTVKQGQVLAMLDQSDLRNDLA
ncbi:efflux RND transporter periplasmic adaptor subunit, partial [Bacillus halotolerans]